MYQRFKNNNRKGGKVFYDIIGCVIRVHKHREIAYKKVFMKNA